MASEVGRPGGMVWKFLQGSHCPVWCQWIVNDLIMGFVVECFSINKVGL